MIFRFLEAMKWGVGPENDKKRQKTVIFYYKSDFFTKISRFAAGKDLSETVQLTKAQLLRGGFGGGLGGVLTT